MRFRQQAALLLLGVVVAACSSAPPTDAPTSNASTRNVQPSAGASRLETPLPSADLQPLPSPAAMPAPDDPPESARQLVGDVLAGGDGATAALLRIYLESGIPVLGHDGRAISGSPSGVAVEGWTLQAVVDLAPRQGSMVLGDLAESMTAIDPSLEAAEIGPAILEDLQAAPDSDDQAIAFWAQAIDEFGQQRDGTDTFAAGDPTLAVLNGFQIHLLTSRLVQDIVLDSGGLAPSGRTGMLAVVAPRPLDVFTAEAGPPCAYNEVEQRVVQGGEQVENRGFNAFLDYLEKKGVEGAGKLASGLKVANVISSFVMFALTYLLLTVDFELKGGPPLKRTKDRTPGENKELKATIRYDIGKAQTINCFRLMFASVGLPFSIPPNGPLARAPVSFVGLQGFGTPGGIVQFQGGDIVHARADDDGIAKINVEGTPQRRDLPTNAKPREKKATVRVLVQIKDSSLGDDLIDAIETAEVFVGGGAVLGPIKVAMEMLYRSKLLAPKDYTFAVTDWGATLHFFLTADRNAPIATEHMTLEGEISADFITDAALHEREKFDGLATYDVVFKGIPGECEHFCKPCSKLGADEWTGSDVAVMQPRRGGSFVVQLGVDGDRVSLLPPSECQILPVFGLATTGFLLIIAVDDKGVATVTAEPATPDQYTTVQVSVRQ